LWFKGSFTLATFVGKNNSDNANDSDTLQWQLTTCLFHLGWRNTDRIISIFCCAAQGGKGKYSRVAVAGIIAVVITNKCRQCKRAFKLQTYK
jgi:hypothetical protein